MVAPSRKSGIQKSSYQYNSKNTEWTARRWLTAHALGAADAQRRVNAHLRYLLALFP